MSESGAYVTEKGATSGMPAAGGVDVAYPLLLTIIMVVDGAESVGDITSHTRTRTAQGAAATASAIDLELLSPQLRDRQPLGHA